MKFVARWYSEPGDADTIALYWTDLANEIEATDPQWAAALRLAITDLVVDAEYFAWSNANTYTCLEI